MVKSREYISDSGSDEEVDYQPPKHFHKLKPVSLPDNKEIWLIKAPKGFDFSSLKTLPISFNPLESSAEFEQNGTKLVMQEDLTDINVNDTANKYKVLSKHMKDIKRFYNIQQRVKIPEISYSKVVKKRQNVRQITGLKAQHFATGYGRDAADVPTDNETEANVTEDVEMSEAQEEPKKVKKEKKEKKDKKEKKSKKEKKEKK